MSNYYGSSRGLFRSRRSRRGQEEVDPMTSMSGIGDVMLVFACGLMTALVIAWSVDLGQFQQVDVGEEIENVEEFDQGIEAGGSTYIQKGTVYQDAATGQYYLVEETPGAEAAATDESE